MKRLTVSLVLATALRSICAQEHLEPEPGVLSDKYGKYYSAVQNVFATAYRPDVILRIVIAASFVPEEVAGIRRKAKGYQAFAVTSETAVWDTYLIVNHQFAEDGLKDLKRRGIPFNYQDIRTHLYSAPISEEAAQKIIEIWRKMLLDARPPKEGGAGVDGATYRFDLSSLEGKSAEIWSPSEQSKTGAMIKLGITLSEYAKGKSDLNKLTSATRRME